MNGIHHSDRGDGNGTTLQDRPPGLNDGLCARPHFIDFVLLCDADREEMVRNDGVVGAYTKPCEGYSVPCDRPPDPPLSAAERALQEEEDEEANRRLAAYDILWEQADAIASSEQSTRRATVLRGIATMQPFVDRGEIRSSRIYEMFLTAAWDARGGYAYSACTACGSHPAQGMAWWLDTDDVDVVCDTCRTCARCDERGIRWLSDGENICETCRQRSMGYVSRTAASIHPEAVEWYYAGRVPLGALTLLVGPPGLGKTTFACELAARGSRGELVGAAADVIFATTEDSLAHTLVPRFTAADADLDRVHFMQILEAGFEVGLTLPDHLPRLQDLVEKTGANLIVLDPVVGHLSSNIDSYKDHSVRRALAPLAALAESTGAAILGVMHLNKSSSTDVLTRVSGSVAFGAAARSVLLLGEDPNAVEGGPERLLIHGKSNLGPPAVAVRLRVDGRTIPTTEGGEIETSGIAWLGDDPTATAARVLGGHQEPSSLDAATGFLREVLTDGPLPSSEVKALAADEDITERTLKRAKKELGIESKKKGFGTGSAVLWSLPTTPEFPILGQL